jgi:hypothetical protein
MEPKHPFYIIGNVYSFKILAINHNDKIIEVEDFFGNKIQAFSYKFIDSNIDEIPLRVTNIKKGKPLVALPANDNNIEIDFGASVLAYVDAMVVINNENYYRLSALSKYVSLLKLKHYNSYGFNVGDDIECKYLEYILMVPSN